MPTWARLKSAGDIAGTPVGIRGVDPVSITLNAVQHPNMMLLYEFGAFNGDPMKHGGVLEDVCVGVSIEVDAGRVRDLLAPRASIGECLLAPLLSDSIVGSARKKAGAGEVVTDSDGGGAARGCIL